MAYTLDFALALGSSQTGLTLKAQLVDTSGVNVGSEVTTGFVEMGVGNYLWHYTAIPDDHRGGVKFLEGATLKAFAAINPEEAEYTDVKTSSIVAVTDPLTQQVPGSYAAGTAGAALGRLGSGQISTVAPVASNGDVTIVQGDDYYAADSRGLEWTDVDAAWPDLTGATIEFSIYQTESTSTFDGTVTNPGATNQEVRVELTAAETGGLITGEYRFDIQATLANTHVVTLVFGKTVITEDISP